MSQDQIAQALQTLAPGAQWSISSSDLSGLIWLDQVIPRPTDAAINAAVAVIVAAGPPTKVDLMDQVAFQILFNHENRIRTLESKAPITVTQFKTAIRTLIGS